jgi:hypothetical protein
VAVDGDGNHYVWDFWKKSDASLREIADKYKSMTRLYDMGRCVGDSAARREAKELNLNYGMSVTPADKFSKGENGESNRRAGIFHINQLLADSKLMVSDRCKDLIREFETHYYKDTERDGSVIKENDDGLDSARYALFSIRKDRMGSQERKFRNEYGMSSKSAVLRHNESVLIPQRKY